MGLLFVFSFVFVLFIITFSIVGVFWGCLGGGGGCLFFVGGDLLLLLLLLGFF